MEPAVLQSLMHKLAMAQRAAGADATAAGGVNSLPARPQAKLMARTDLPAADFGGTIQPDEITLAEMPDGPFRGVGKALDATSRFRAPTAGKVADFLGEAQESVMGRGGAPFEISKDMKLALKTEDLLGFDGPR